MTSLLVFYIASFTVAWSGVLLIIGLAVWAKETICQRRQRYKYPKGYQMPLLLPGDRVSWYTHNGLNGSVMQAWTEDDKNPMLAVRWDDGLVTVIDRQLVTAESESIERDTDGVL